MRCWCGERERRPVSHSRHEFQLSWMQKMMVVVVDAMPLLLLAIQSKIHYPRIYFFSIYPTYYLLFSPTRYSLQKNLIELVACRVCVLLPCAFLCVDSIVWDGNGRPFYLDCRVCKEKSIALASSHPTLLSFQTQKVESAATKTNS